MYCLIWAVFWPTKLLALTFDCFTVSVHCSYFSEEKLLNTLDGMLRVQSPQSENKVTHACETEGVEGLVSPTGLAFKVPMKN